MIVKWNRMKSPAFVYCAAVTALWAIRVQVGGILPESHSLATGGSEEA